MNQIPAILASGSSTRVLPVWLQPWIVLVAMSLIAGKAAVADLNDGLLLHYGFDTNAGVVVTDMSGTGNNGTIQGGGNWIPEGRLGGGLALVASADFVDAGTGINLANKSFSVAMWAKRGRESHNVDEYIMGQGESVKNKGLHLVFRTDNRTGFCFYNNDLHAMPQPYGNLNWHHWAFTYDADSNVRRIYRDGLLAASDVSTADFEGSGTLRLGNGWNMWNNWNGKLDDVRVYERTLSPDDVQAVQRAGKGAQQVELRVLGLAGLYGWPEPYGYGVHFVDEGAFVSNRVASPLVTGPGSRHVCTGWIGSGDVPASGSSSDVTIRATTNSTLTWTWQQECWLDTEVSGEGCVSVADGWYTNGSEVSISAMASNGFRFVMWKGDVALEQAAENPLTIRVDRPRSLVAVFQPTAIDTRGLVAYYTFDDDAGGIVWDVSGHENHAQMLGSPAYEDSISGLAPRFTSRLTYVAAPSTGLDCAGWTQMTVSAWVKPLSYTAYGVVVDRGTDAAASGYYLSIQKTYGGRFSIRGVESSENVEFASFAKDASPYPAVNTWYHLVGIYDGTQLLCYVNGVLDGSTLARHPGQAIMDLPGARTQIGNSAVLPYRTWPDQYFHGQIDEVAVYDRALSSNEVLRLFLESGGTTVEFVVSGQPFAAGSPAPLGYGVHWLPIGSIITNSVAETVIEDEGTRFRCMGWEGFGGVPHEGISNVVALLVQERSRLTWLWEADYRMGFGVSGEGRVAGTPGWYVAGSSACVTATPAAGFRFALWSGNVPAELSMRNPLTLTMDRPRFVTAVFVRDGTSVDGLRLWNRLGSDHEIVHSEIGPEGLYDGAGITNGVFGGAMVVTHAQTNRLRFPASVIPGNRGTIELWMKLDGLPASIPWGEHPALLKLSAEGYGRLGLHLNGNDGLSGGGLCSWVRSDTATTGGFGSWTYSQSLRGKNPAEWHHYALTWDDAGIAGLVGGARRVAVFVDGELNSGRWTEVSSKDFGAPTNGFLAFLPLMGVTGTVAYDNIKIWNYPKINFADRFVEGPVPGETVTLVVDGNPSTYSHSVPYSYGVRQVSVGVVVTNVAISPVSGAVGARYVCAGWTGTGDVPSSGSNNVAVFTLNTNSILTWLWNTEYRLDLATDGAGEVDGSGGWILGGTMVSLTATPSNGCRFTGWCGDVPDGMKTVNPLVLLMDRARSVTAMFGRETYSLAGNVYYSGPQEGSIHIDAFEDRELNELIGSTEITSPGRYVLNGIPGSRSIWIAAFLDGNGNGDVDAMEPAGRYTGNPVAMVSGSRNGLDIYLRRISAPLNVEARGGVRSIVISWVPNLDPGVVGYNVYRFDMEWGRFERLNSAPLGGLSFTDTGVVLGETYYYYVSAVMPSEYRTGYQESPASAIVFAKPGGIALWMPDYVAGVGEIARLRINMSDATGVMGERMALRVSYDPAVLTPLSQSDPGLETVETTVLTAYLTVSNNAVTATGVLDIATLPVDPPGNTTLWILSCTQERADSLPGDVVADYSTDAGVSWEWINDGRSINRGRPYSVDLGPIADASTCVLRVVGHDVEAARRSDSHDGFVKLFRDGDSLADLPGVQARRDVPYGLRKYVDSSLTLNIGERDVVYMFELGSATNGPAANFQDLVVLLEFNRGRRLLGGGHLFDLLFRVNGVPPGTQQTNEILSAVMQDQLGNVLNVDHSDVAVFTVQSTFILGDVNGDGVVTVAGDFTLAMKLAVGQRPPTEYELMAGDLDGDGRITKLDATLIQRIALGKALNPEPVVKGTGVIELDEVMGGYEVSIAPFVGTPGNVVVVPISVDNAGGLASLDLRLTYNGDVLSVVGVTNAPLTSSFGVAFHGAPGYVDIAMSSATPLPGGSGPILYVSFLISADAAVGSVTDVTLARLGVGGEYGENMAWSSSLSVSNGMAATAWSDSEDSDGDGLSDYAEQMMDGLVAYNPWHVVSNPYGTDTDVFNPDTDADGMCDGDEQIAGTSAVDGTDVLSVFRCAAVVGQPGWVEVRWPTVFGRTYRVEVSTNLAAGFLELTSGLPGTGAERVHIDTGADGVTPRYYRVWVGE